MTGVANFRVVQGFIKRGYRKRHTESKYVLMVRECGERIFKLPGGRIEGEESPLQAMWRELHEELEGIMTRREWLHYIGPTDLRHPKYGIIPCDRFHVDIDTISNPRPNKVYGEIAEVRWFPETRAHPLAYRIRI